MFRNRHQFVQNESQCRIIDECTYITIYIPGPHIRRGFVISIYMEEENEDE